jgi:tetratricopeptide (TPR) repeat protein
MTIFETAESICKRHGQNQSIILANLYSTYGTIYRNCKNPTKARKFFELAIERREAAVAKGLMESSNIRLADAYMHLGSALLSLNDIPQSLDFHLRAINIREQHRDCEPQILALSYINSGWAYWQDNQLDKAAEVLEKSLQIMEALQENGSGQSGQ